MKNKTKVKGYLGIFLIVIMLLSFITWETYLRDDLMYEEIAVLNVEKMKGDPIKPEEIIYKRVEVGSVSGAIKNGNFLQGAVPVVDLPAGMPLSKHYFEDEDQESKGTNQLIFEIPEDWIYSVPQSLRAKDEIYLYEVKEGQEVEDLIIQRNNIEEIEKSGEYEFVLTTTAKYVKDGNNKEVINTGETRQNGSATIKSIEVVGTAQDLANLETRVKNGSKFIIMYKEAQ